MWRRRRPRIPWRSGGSICWRSSRTPGPLAARDPRCKVVATRTELDWAMKHEQICIWAPSKIVLDAVDGPSAKASDAVALAAWFANLMEAQEMLVIGSALPQAASVPLQKMSVASEHIPLK